MICRTVAQISDDDLAAAAEQEMLDAATIGLPGSRSAAEALARPGAPEAGVSPGESPEASGRPAETASGHPAGEATPPQQCDDWAPPGLDPRELRRLGEDLTYRADPDGWRNASANGSSAGTSASA